MNKKQLRISLSDVISFTNPKLTLEQYFTPPELVADMFDIISKRIDLRGKLAGDFGAGTGVFSIALAISGCE